METRALDLNAVLGQKQQWVVPVYQRHYGWRIGPDSQLDKFWRDLQDKATEKLGELEAYPHYFGALIFSRPEKQEFGTVPKQYLVDGQQRITTFKLALIAMREVASEYSLKRIESTVEAYLFNDISSGMKDPNTECFKLWPSAYDRDMFQLIAKKTSNEVRKFHTPSYFYKNGRIKYGKAPEMLNAYWHLLLSMREFIEERKEFQDTPEQVLESLLSGLLSGFQIVVIALDQQDDAQEIFASLNGLGKPLTPFDLIRNDIFHRAQKAQEDDEKLFEERWKFFETHFWSEEVRQGRFKRARSDHLIAHAVAAETAREVNVSKVAAEYQRFARERNFPTIAEEIDTLVGHGRTYRTMDDGSDGPIGDIGRFLRTWDISTCHPFVLAVAAATPDPDRQRRLLKYLEAYIVRRELCALTSKNYNKVAPSMVRAIRGAEMPERALQVHLQQLKGDISKMPRNEEILRSILETPIYEHSNNSKLVYIFKMLEYNLRDSMDENVSVEGTLWIEHIMPRKWAEHWSLPNGNISRYEDTFQALLAGEKLSSEDTEFINRRNILIHTLGNLTLLSPPANRHAGKKSWEGKCERLESSLLAINRRVLKITKEVCGDSRPAVWNEEVIVRRGEEMSKVVNKIWPVDIIWDQ